MITLLLIDIVKSIANSVWVREGFIILLIAAFAMAAVLLIRYVIRKKKYVLLVLAVLLLAETCVASQFVRMERTVEVEYIGQTATTLKAQGENVLWFTSSGAELDVMERRMGCSLQDLSLDTSSYSYLFVLGHWDVSLTYASWDFTFGNIFPPTEVAFIGSLSVSDAPQDGVLYVFQFAPKAIIPNELQWK